MDVPEIWDKLTLVMEELIAAELPRNKARVKTAFLSRMGTIFDDILGSHGIYSRRKLLNKEQLIAYIGQLPNMFKSNDLFDLMSKVEMEELDSDLPRICSVESSVDELCTCAEGTVKNERPQGMTASDGRHFESFDEEKEAVHLFSGLPYALLEYDEESHMLWEDSIVCNIMVNIASMEDQPIISILRNLGCTDTFLEITGTLDEHYLEHCTLQEMFENIVQIAISYATKEVNKDVRGFPSSCSALQTNTWVPLNVGNLQVNLGKRSDNDSKLSIYLCDSRTAFDCKTYLFHGTDWESAINIATNGIDLAEGKPGTDFGSQCFYLGYSFDMAVAMAVKKGGKAQAAVVAYHAKWLHGIDSHNFGEPNDDWKSTVFKFRRTSDNGHIAFRDKHRDIGIMRGPLCGNARSIRKLVDFHDVKHIVNADETVPKQVAIRTDDMARFANVHVKGIVFCSALLNEFHERTQTDDAK